MYAMGYENVGLIFVLGWLIMALVEMCADIAYRWMSRPEDRGGKRA